MNKLTTWDNAIKFCLPGVKEDCNEKTYCLDDLLKNTKKGLIVYFYPKDNTPWCTTEAVDFSNNIEKIEELWFKIVGISKDNINSHCKFIEKHWLKILLLSDQSTEVMKKYWAWWEKKSYWKITEWVIRSTFIIWKDGKILKSYYNVRAKWHVEKVIKDLENL